MLSWSNNDSNIIRDGYANYPQMDCPQTDASQFTNRMRDAMINKRPVYEIANRVKDVDGSDAGAA